MSFMVMIGSVCYLLGGTHTAAIGLLVSSSVVFVLEMIGA